MEDYRAHTYVADHATQDGVERLRKNMSDALYAEALKQIGKLLGQGKRADGDIEAFGSNVTYSAPNGWAAVKVCYDYSRQIVYSADASGSDIHPYRDDHQVEVFQALRTEGCWASVRQYPEKEL